MGDVTTMRDAAAAIRAGRVPTQAIPAVLAALADWLDGEAATQGEMPAMVSAFNIGINRAGGPSSYLSLGRTPDGEIAMRSDTTEAALAVCAQVLAAPTAPITPE